MATAARREKSLHPALGAERRRRRREGRDREQLERGVGHPQTGVYGTMPLATMCGIAGILGRLDSTNRTALERMSNAIRHRGPDDVGTWESAPGPDGAG